jgi:hypothetical protein
MSKKIYPNEDINDLVADDLEKGGKGSGIRGHRTPKQIEASKSKVFSAMDQVTEAMAQDNYSDEDDFQQSTIGQMVDNCMRVDESLELIPRSELLQHVKAYGAKSTTSFKDPDDGSKMTRDQVIEALLHADYTEEDLEGCTDKELNKLLNEGKNHPVNKKARGEKSILDQIKALETTYRKQYAIAEDFQSSSDPEIRAEAEEYHKRGNEAEEKAEKLKRENKNWRNS